MKNKQTAVEWLEEVIEYKNQGGCRYIAFDVFKLQELFQQAKEMEKQQIIDAYQNKRYIDYPYPMQEAQIYYNETFKNK